MTLITNPCVNKDSIPEFQLSQNEPDPFKVKTTIKYCIPFRTKVVIIVVNSEGDIVEKLISTEHEAGQYEVDFLADGLTEGTYFYQLIAGQFSDTRRMILLK